MSQPQPLRLHAPAALPLPAAPGALRVLVVDDNTDTAHSTAWLLERWGHDARAATDGEAAVTLALAWRPDVLLLDLGLPDLDGFEVCRRVRGHFAGGWRPLLFAVTGFTDPENRGRAAAAGFNFFLSKPVDTDALERLLGLLAAGPVALGRDRSPGPQKARA